MFRLFSSYYLCLHINNILNCLKSNLKVHDLRNVSSNISDYKITVQDSNSFDIERHNKENKTDQQLDITRYFLVAAYKRD